MAIPPQEVSAERALASWPEPENPQNGDARVDAVLGAAPLRIAQIELVGFKSFRDRTVLRFPSGVTGIVGPNGCGKSNLVDAIRWVLGEQSAKRLRGEGMEDVIFGGNERQAPLGMAQVSIVFETDGLPLDQFALLKEGGNPISTAGPSEIMVTRRYLRSGESEYLMNGLPCRLRDITELFLGTGVGTKAYAIIEQGRVEQLVGAKPEELRLFIEEAAGTTLYRSRRQVAERKMERTQENLQRVRDVLHEVERQLAVLRRQAKRAEQYRVLQSEIEALDLALSGRRHARLRLELDDLEGERAAASTRESELTSALENAERARRAARTSEAEAQRRVQQVQASAFDARAARDACRHELARLEARAIELTDQDAATARDHARAVEECGRTASERAEAEQAAVALAGVIAETEASQAVQERAFEDATAALATAARELEDAKVTLVDALAAEARARNARSALEARQVEEEARAQRLRTQAAALKVREAEALTRATAGEKGVLDLQARLELLEGTKRTRAQELRQLLEERASWEATLDGMKEGLARARSRRDSLRELEDSHAGYGEGVRAVLASSSRDDALGLVAEILDVPAAHERALAAALGEQLQAVVMRDQEVASEAVRALRRAGAGRATCIPRAARLPNGEGPHPAGAERLLELVRARPGYEEVAEALLGHVLLTRDLDAALAVWQTSNGAWTIVTPAGETVDASGAVTGGSHRAEETLLAERRERRALDVDIGNRERDVASARKRQQDLTTAVEARESDLRAVDAELAKATVAVVAGEKDVERIRLEMRDLAEQTATVAAELEDVQAHLGALASEAAALDRELMSCEARRADLEASAATAESRRSERQQAAGALQDALTERRIALAEERARRTALEEMIDRLRRTDEQARERAAALETRRKSDALALTRTRADAAAAAEQRVALESAADERGAAVAAAEVEGVAARAAAETAEKSIAEFQTELETVRARLAAIDLQAAERRLALEHLEQTIRERYQRELANAPSVAGDDGPATEEERLTHLRQRIAAMGDVNVAALSEVAELEERQKFLDAQRADLEQALEDLRKTISRLNRASRTRFRDTFERVDATFREVFPKLFHGGKAQLRLTEEEHLLDSGVEIVVQPPGKRIGPLDLLSGGEKALTAVSLIFALFLTKPSPFCFLDEVDAPLDDANIGRFNAMIREMSNRSQFILITHNKRTMEVADTLYGITMEEPGVSKVVSVRLPE